MSWYVAHDGRQVWVDARDQVLTCDKQEEALPLVQLTYLASKSTKAVYAEHAVEDDDSGKKGKKKEQQAGRQRGFVVRVDHMEERVQVLPPFQAAVDKLMSSGAVSRVDLDEVEGGKRRNKKGKEAKEKEEPPEEPIGVPLGPNECRVESVQRCQHQAHGVGFTVSVSEIGATQRVHLYTANKELSLNDWHNLLLEALPAGGARVLMGRMSPAIAPDPPDGKDGKSKKDAAKEEEDDWLDSLMGRCMVKDKETKPRSSASGGYAEAKDADPKAEPPKAPVQVPPWLRTRR